MPVRLTDKATRDLVTQAKQLGFELEPQLNGSGHPVLVHNRTRERYPIAATPSDWRGMKNAVAALERLSGQKLPRTGKRRKGRSGQHQTDFTLDAVITETARWHGEYGDFVARIRQEHTDKVLEFKILSMGEPTRGEMNDLLHCTRKILLLEEILGEYNQPFEKFNPVVALVTR